MIALVLVAALAAFGVLLARVSPPTTPDVGAGAHVLPVPLEIPEFALVDHRGEPFDRTRLEGGWTLLFFGYTTCPDICPITLESLAQVVERLGPAEATRIVFVSVDPERDSTERLAEYVAFFHPEIVGATGEAREIERLTSALGAFHEKAESGADDDFYLVDHAASAFLVGPRARLQAILDDPTDPGTFVQLLTSVRALEGRLD